VKRSRHAGNNRRTSKGERGLSCATPFATTSVGASFKAFWLLSSASSFDPIVTRVAEAADQLDVGFGFNDIVVPFMSVNKISLNYLGTFENSQDS
jgi:hypothetical protein